VNPPNLFKGSLTHLVIIIRGTEFSATYY
jgi:hypothetical protein